MLKSYPGADVDSDHNLVMMKVAVKLKRIQKGKSRKKWMLEGLDKKQRLSRKKVQKG